MHLPRFRYLRPDSLGAAAEALREYGPAASLVSGGTDLLPRLKYGLARPELLVSLKSISPTAPSVSPDGRLRIDALTSLAAVARSPAIREHAPLLGEAALCVGSGQIRNAATLGGNLCLESRCLYYNQSHTFQFVEPCLKRGGDLCYFAPGGKKCFAVFAADTVPALICLDAAVTAVGPEGTREFPIEKLYSGDALRPVTLGAAEIVMAISLPSGKGRRVCAYRKHGRRQGLEFAGLTVAVAAELADDRKTCQSARIAVGSVAGTPLRARTAETSLVGQDLSRTDVRRNAAREVAQEVRPVAHHGYAAAYLRQCLEVEARRALETAMGFDPMAVIENA